MKASESLPNYDSKSRETTNFIIKSIKTVCKDAPSRRAGTEGEEKAQQYVKDTMEKFADSIETQEITVKSAKSTVPFYQGIFSILSVVFACVSGFVPLLTDYLILCAILCMGVAQAIDIFKAKKNSKNIICVKNPSGNAERRIVFMGNINSPVERKLLRISGSGLEKFTVLYFLVGCLVCLFYDLYYVLNGADTLSPYVNLFEITLIPACILIMNFYNPKQDVQGATGNLTGTFDSMAVMQYLSYNSLNLENTQLVSVSVGAGAYGAKEFAKEYSKKYTDIPTVFVSIDCLQSDKCFSYTVLNTDSGLIEKAAENANIKITGGKDTLSSSLIAGLKGVKAVRISAADNGENFVYAAREDTVEKISPMAIEAGLKLSLETAYLFDEKGI